MAPALYFSPAPQRLPSPHHILNPPSPCLSNCSDDTTLPAISRPTSRSPLPSLSSLTTGTLASSASRSNAAFAMAFATSSPGASAHSTAPPICQNCLTSTTPLWRRDEAGSVLCNACGLFLKLHGRPRPPSLKTDVIKSRNRVKNSGQNQKKKPSPFDSPSSITSNISPPRSENGTPSPSHRSLPSNGNFKRSGSPHSCPPTPLPPASSLFDSSYAPHDSPTILPALHMLNHPSPAVSTCSLGDRFAEPPMTIDSLISSNNKLKTRVAELELVNDLFRGRVSELEQSEASARRSESSRKEIEVQLRQCIDASERRESELKRRLEMVERELGDCRRSQPQQQPQTKKVRVSDLTR